MEIKSFVNSNIAEDMAERLQAYLRKYEKDEKLVILKIMKEFGKGFTSIVFKIATTGTRGNGKPYTRSLMWKTISQTRPANLFLNTPYLFLNEGYIYGKVLPILGSYGPACIYYDEQNIIMEDLNEKGYVQHMEYMDLNHTIFILKTFAKFHASSLALKIHDPERFDKIATSIQEVIYVDSPTSRMRECVGMCIQNIIDCIKLVEPQTQALQTVKNILFSHLKDTFDIYKKLFSSKQKYHTICHGDPWINNMLFLYDDNDKLIDMKLIDYQAVRYTSIFMDIHFFIYSSVQSSLIENSYESLITIYHSALIKELRQLHVSEEILAELGKEWLETDLKKYAFFGMTAGSWVTHVILISDKDVELLENEAFLNFDISGLNKSQKKLDRIKCLVTHYYNRYHLGIIRDDLEPISIAE